MLGGLKMWNGLDVDLYFYVSVIRIVYYFEKLMRMMGVDFLVVIVDELLMEKVCRVDIVLVEIDEVVG